MRNLVCVLKIHSSHACRIPRVEIALLIEFMRAGFLIIRPKVLDIPTILGTTTHLPAPGAAEFTIDGQVVRLEPVLEDPKSTDLFFILRDTTSKTTTYGSGRFLYTDLPDHGVSQPGEVWLDFNRLVNPPCAFTAYATCPLPPAQNRLNVAIPAGEQRYHD